MHLAAIAKEVLSTTGLFYSGDSPVHTGQQSGYFDVAASDAVSATGGDSPPPWAPVPTPSRSPDVSVQDAPAPPTISIGRWREPGELGSTADDFGGTAAASVRSPRAARRPEDAAAGRLNDEAGPRGVDRYGHDDTSTRFAICHLSLTMLHAVGDARAHTKGHLHVAERDRAHQLRRLPGPNECGAVHDRQGGVCTPGKDSNDVFTPAPRFFNDIGAVPGVTTAACIGIPGDARASV